MQQGDPEVGAGCGNKLRAAISHAAPDSALSELHRGMAEPGNGKPEEAQSKHERTDRPSA